jgi:hypothetical protein
LVSWVQKLPKQVKLAPHETLTVKLHLEVPSAVSPGDYSAYVVASATGGGKQVTGTPTQQVVVASPKADDSDDTGGSNGVKIDIGQLLSQNGGASITIVSDNGDPVDISQLNGQGVTKLKLVSGNGDSAPAKQSVSVGKLVYHAGK